MFLPHYDTILHIAVIIIFIKKSHILKKNYFQFYPSKKALVIITNAFTIIINSNSFSTSPNINWQQRHKVIHWAITYRPFFFFSLFVAGLFLFFLFFFFFPPSMLQFFPLFSLFFFLFFVVGMFFFSLSLFFCSFSLVCSFSSFSLGFFQIFSRSPPKWRYSFCLWPIRGSSTQVRVTHVAWKLAPAPN